MLEAFLLLPDHHQKRSSVNKSSIILQGLTKLRVTGSVNDSRFLLVRVSAALLQIRLHIGVWEKRYVLFSHIKPSLTWRLVGRRFWQPTSGDDFYFQKTLRHDEA